MSWSDIGIQRWAERHVVCWSKIQKLKCVNSLKARLTQSSSKDMNDSNYKAEDKRK